MMKFLGFLFLVALALGAWGYMNDVFDVSKSEENGKTKFGLTIDNEKAAHALDDVMKKAHETIDYLDRKLDDLRSKSSKASGESKVKFELEIEQIEAQKGAAAQQLDALKNTKGDDASALQQRLEETLNKANEPRASEAVEKDGQ